MSARTIKNPATVSGQGTLSSQTIRITNGNNYCALDSNSTGDLLVNGVPVGGGGGGAVDAVLAGDGMSVVTVEGDATVTNEGVLELTAGANVTITGTKDNYTINSSASGGAVDSVIAGAGISVSGTTDVTVSNTGVLALTAGSNISITGTNDNLTINTNAGSLPYTLVGGNFNFGPVEIAPNSGVLYVVSFTDKGFIATANTIATISGGKSFKQYNLSPSITFGSGGTLMADFNNFTDTALTGVTFEYSVIAINY